MADIFVVYSSKDKEFCDLLTDHLDVLTAKTGITYFRDRRGIEPGDEWEKVIHKNIAAAKCAIVIISPAAMSSDFIKDNEINPLLDSGKKIFPLKYKESALLEGLVKFQAFPPGDPLTDLDQKNLDIQIINFVKKIESYFSELNNGDYRSKIEGYFNLAVNVEEVARNYADRYNKKSSVVDRIDILRQVVSLYLYQYAKKNNEDSAKKLFNGFDESVDPLGKEIKVSLKDVRYSNLYATIAELLKNGLPKIPHFAGIDEIRTMDLFVNPAYPVILLAMKRMKKNHGEALAILDSIQAESLIRDCALYRYVYGQCSRKKNYLSTALTNLRAGIKTIENWESGNRSCPCSAKCKGDFLKAELYRGQGTVYRKWSNSVNNTGAGVNSQDRLDNAQQADMAFRKAVEVLDSNEDIPDSIRSDIYFSYGYFKFENFFMDYDFNNYNGNHIDYTIKDIFKKSEEYSKLNSAPTSRSAILELFENKNDGKDALMKFDGVIDQIVTGEDINNLNIENLLTLLWSYVSLYNLSQIKVNKSSRRFKSADWIEEYYDNYLRYAKISEGPLECHAFDLDVIDRTFKAQGKEIVSKEIRSIISDLKARAERARQSL